MEQDDELMPTVLVIFGITGDLSRRYLLPALGQIKRAGQLPGNFEVIGVTRRDINKSYLLNKSCRNLSEHISILKMDVSKKDDYQLLKKSLPAGSKHQIILHLSVPPEIVS